MRAGHWIVLAVILGTVCSSLFQAIASEPPTDGKNAAPTPTEIPYTVTEDDVIVLDAVLNRSDSLKMMLHTAARDVTITQETTLRIKSLRWDGIAEVQSWGGKSKTRFSDSNHLSLGSLTYDNVQVWENLQTGVGTDGKIGLDLFQHKVVELDFQRSRMVLHQCLPDSAADLDPVEARVDDDGWYLKIVLPFQNMACEHSVLLHSGYSGGLLLDDEFVSKYPVASEVQNPKGSKLTDSFGNEIEITRGTYPMIMIGSHPLRGVPIGFFSGALGSQKKSVLGVAAIKQFRWYIDIPNQNIYLTR